MILQRLLNKKLDEIKDEELLALARRLNEEIKRRKLLEFLNY